MRLRLLVWLIGLAVSAALLAPTAALATETQTIHFTATLVVSRPNPCTGAGATETITAKGVMHITTLDNGTVHVSFMDVGTITVVQDGPNLPTYSGHFTETGAENHNSKSFTTSFHRNVVLRGSDGSLLKEHVLVHLTVNANGTVTSSIETETHTCP
jgi:type 1 fimbria pilin